MRRERCSMTSDVSSTKWTPQAPGGATSTSTHHEQSRRISTSHNRFERTWTRCHHRSAMEQASAEAKTMRLEAVCRLYSGFLCTAASHSIAELDFSLAARQLEIRKQSENDVETASVSSHTSNQSSISQSSRASSRSSFSVGSSALSSRSGITGPRPSPSSTATSCVSLRDLETRKVEIERELERVQQELEERRRQERLAGIGERPFARQPSSARIESITSRKPS